MNTFLVLLLDFCIVDEITYPDLKAEFTGYKNIDVVVGV